MISATPLPLDLKKLGQDTDKAIAANKFDDVFTEVNTAIQQVRGEPRASADQRLYLETINRELSAYGFPAINLTFDQSNQVHVTDARGHELNTSNLKERSKISQTSDEYWKRRERNDSEAGIDITVRNGDNLWKIAEHTAEERLGHKMNPTNPRHMQALIDSTRALAASNHIPIGSDGNAMIKEGDRIRIPRQSPLEAQHHRLMDVAGDHVQPANLKSFEAEVYAFENRAKFNGISQDQVAKSLGQISRLLEANPAVMSASDRELAARSLLHALGHPLSSVAQGEHSTCGVTSLAKRELARTPAAMAEIVATTAITGKWIDPADGKAIRIRPGDLIPGEEEQTFPPADDKARTFAVQIPNAVMINDILQRQDPPQFYSVEEPSSDNETGETVRFADGSLVGDGNFAGNTIQELIALGQRIDPGNRNYFLDLGRNVNSFNDLKNELARMKNEGLFPILAGVEAGDPIFRQHPEWLDWLEGDGSGGHGLCISSYDEKSGRVRLSNHWGQINNITIDLPTLYRAMHIKPPATP